MLFFGLTLVGFVLDVTVPRLLNLTIAPGRVYRLYGFHYWVHRLIVRLTNRKFFTELFGDSSYIVGYLRSLGYKLTPVVQTGSNFGMAVQHENPYLSSVGSGTVVADGLRSSTPILQHVLPVSDVSIGRDNSSATTSPTPPRAAPATTACSERRSSSRSRGGPGGRGPAGFAQLRDPSDGRARQQPRCVGPRRAPPPAARQGQAQRRHDRALLLTRWIHLFGSRCCPWERRTSTRCGGRRRSCPTPFPACCSPSPSWSVERAVDFSRSWRRRALDLRPRLWRHERAWKVPSDTYFKLFDGTPFKSVLWRLLGVRIGRGSSTTAAS